MEADQTFLELKELAANLGVTVMERNLRNVGIHVRSGYCRLKGKDVFVINRTDPLKKKIRLLLEFLKTREHEHIFIKPFLRNMLQKEGPEH